MASGAIRVRATMQGYYNHLLRDEGEVFIIKNEDAFSDIWMARVNADAVSIEPDSADSDGRTPTSMREARKGAVVHPGKDEEVFEVEGEGGAEEAEDTPDEPSTDAPVDAKPKGKGKK